MGKAVTLESPDPSSLDHIILMLPIIPIHLSPGEALFPPREAPPYPTASGHKFRKCVTSRPALMMPIGFWSRKIGKWR